jgi:hypothetical protein
MSRHLARQPEMEESLLLPMGKSIRIVRLFEMEPSLSIKMVQSASDVKLHKHLRLTKKACPLLLRREEMLLKKKTKRAIKTQRRLKVRLAPSLQLP